MARTLSKTYGIKLMLYNLEVIHFYICQPNTERLQQTVCRASLNIFPLSSVIR